MAACNAVASSVCAASKHYVCSRQRTAAYRAMTYCCTCSTVAIRSPLWFGGSTNAAYMNLYMALIDDAIQDVVYLASVADLSYEIKGQTVYNLLAPVIPWVTLRWTGRSGGVCQRAEPKAADFVCQHHQFYQDVSANAREV